MAVKRKKLLKALSALAAMSLSLILFCFALLEPSVRIFGFKSMESGILDNLTKSISIFDKDGMPLESKFTAAGRLYADAGYLPGYVKDAFIAIEDKRFYDHKGLDYKRIAGAVIKDAASLSFKQGGSSITQQLAKNTHLSNEKKLKRKVVEARIAKEIERNYSKEQIIDLYINCVYYGSGAYGIEEASRTYFSKPASKLKLDEAAALAAVINSPAKYSPIDCHDKMLSRRNTVLDCMLSQGKITIEENKYSKSQTTEINFSEEIRALKSYVSEAVAAAKETCFNMDLDDIKIYTYLDNGTQRKLAKEVAAADIAGGEVSALLINNTDGGITAYASTSGASSGTIRRQPASTIKPLAVYAPAIEKRLVTLATPILDEPIRFGKYEPKNMGNKYYGWVPVRKCISESLNIPAVKLIEQVGLDNAKDYLKKVGIRTSPKDGFALALGGMTDGVTLDELTGGYTALACGGEYIKPSFVRQIKDKTGKVLYERNNKKTKVFSRSTAYLVTDSLCTAVKEGTARALKNLDFQVAAKTGTNGNENGNMDAYCMSYTSAQTLGVWIGSKDNKALLPHTVKGGSTAAKINCRILKAVNPSPPLPFEIPSEIKKVIISKSALSEKMRVESKDGKIFDSDAITEYFAADNMPDQLPVKKTVSKEAEKEKRSNNLLDLLIGIFKG